MAVRPMSAGNVRHGSGCNYSSRTGRGESAPRALTPHRADGILPEPIAGARDIVRERPRERIAPAGAVPIQPSLEENRIHGS